MHHGTSMSASLRAQKERFVSGHAGTSVLEVCALAAGPVVLLLLWRLVQHPAAGGGGLFHRARPGSGRLAAEWAVLVLPLVAAQLGVASPAALLGAVGALAGALYATQPASERQQRSRLAQRLFLVDLLRDAMTSHRASLMLVTCIAILGVDFPAFPRRFAKAETFGTGLMDAGVGAFVAAGGLAHGLAAAARRAGQWKGQAKGGSRGSVGRWRKEAGRVAALLGLGLARLAATHLTDYQNHASEYGRHWNFFLTLAALRLLGAACPWAQRSGRAAAAAGAALLAAYQWWLSVAGGRGIGLVHSDERGPGLLSANKEGLASLAGYWALQLLAIAAGHALFWATDRATAAGLAAPAEAAAAAPAAAAPMPAAAAGPPLLVRRSARLSNVGAGSPGPASPGTGLTVRTKPRAGGSQGQQQRRRAQLRLLAALAAGTAALWLAFWAVVTWVQPVSRRACNAPYALWMLALSVQSVAAFVGADALLPGAQPHLLLAVSGAMLPVFLAANLLTGAVNFSVNTLAAPDSLARGIVSAYAAVLCAVAVALHDRWPAGL